MVRCCKVLDHSIEEYMVLVMSFTEEEGEDIVRELIARWITFLHWHVLDVYMRYFRYRQCKLWPHEVHVRHTLILCICSFKSKSIALPVSKTSCKRPTIDLFTKLLSSRISAVPLATVATSLRGKLNVWNTERTSHPHEALSLEFVFYKICRSLTCSNTVASHSRISLQGDYKDVGVLA